MEAWNILLNTATLGTDKALPDADALPEAIRLKMTQTGDAATDLLRQLTALSVYRRSGLVPDKVEATMPLAAAETLPYCSQQAVVALQETLSLDNMPLLGLWLQGCDMSGEIAPPEFLDRLLNIAMRHKELRALILRCGGNRAAWLCGFNPEWNFAPATGNEEEQWATGRPDERRAILRARRQTDPAAALALLQASWESEDAASKAAFVEVLGENAVDADVPFLQSLLQEKGKKVKEAATQLLRRLPGSNMVQLFWTAAREILSIRKEKTMLGLKTKEVLHIALPSQLDPLLFTNGIERLSPVKGLSDDDFILQQLILSVAPSGWETQLQLSPEQIVSLIQQDKKGTLVLPALARAAAQFGDKRWAAVLATVESAYYRNILPLLEGDTKDAYLLRLFAEDPEDAVETLINHTDERIWPEALAEAFLKRTAASPYTYHRGFYAQHAHHLPTTMLEKLGDFKPSEAYYGGMWTGYSTHIQQLIQLRDRIVQAFTATSHSHR